MMADKEHEPMDELEATRGELEGLKQEKETIVRELKVRDATITRLEQAVADKDSEVANLRQAIAEADNKLTDLNNAIAESVASYKALVVESNPGVLAELVTGDTIDEVNKSLKNAQALIERVRQEMESEASRIKVPAGAPPRAPLDLSDLSPREKIQYAIGGKR